MDTRKIDIALAKALFEHKLDPWKGPGWRLQYDTGFTVNHEPLIDDVPHYSSTWRGMGLVVEAMEAKGYEWQVWPKAIEFRPRQRSYDAGPGTSAGYSEGRGHLLNTAIAALKALGVEVSAE